VCGKCGGRISVRRGSIWGWFQKLFGGRQSETKQQPNRIPAEPANANLKPKIERLINAAWGTAEDVQRERLLLPVAALTAASNDALVRVLLEHVRKIAPGLNVPTLVPRIVAEPTAHAAGMFVEEDGWVKISVDTKFFSDQEAARAILCHELCHYVLGASGIREPTTSENERLTDASMFALGLGDIFMTGYQRKAVGEYRTGHRLGYLSDAEYRFVDEYVRVRRSMPERFSSALEELERRFRAILPDESVRQRLILAQRKKYPNKSMNELIEIVINEIARDNRL
jgi:hypothetical protein